VALRTVLPVHVLAEREHRIAGRGLLVAATGGESSHRRQDEDDQGEATAKHGEDPSGFDPAAECDEPDQESPILVRMGFNPFRPQRRSFADYAMVGGALLVLTLLVLWALFG
jgi:hypothetical protein